MKITGLTKIGQARYFYSSLILVQQITPNLLRFIRLLLYKSTAIGKDRRDR